MSQNEDSVKSIDDTTLLYGKITPIELQEQNEKYGLAYKEYRLNDPDKLKYAQALLRSPYSRDYYMAIKILIELINTNLTEDVDVLESRTQTLFEYYISLIIGYFKIEDYDKALFNVNECRRKLRLKVDEDDRLNNLESIIKNRNRFSGFGIAAAVAAIGAIVIAVMSKK